MLEGWIREILLYYYIQAHYLNGPAVCDLRNALLANQCILDRCRANGSNLYECHFSIVHCHIKEKLMLHWIYLTKMAHVGQELSLTLDSVKNRYSNRI